MQVGDRVSVFIAPLPGHRRKGDVTGQTETGTVTRVEGAYVGVELDAGRYITTAAGYCTVIADRRAAERDVVLTEAQAAIASMSLALERGLSLPPVRDDGYPDPNPLNDESGGSK